MAVPPELRLKRFIHIGSENPTYRPGHQFKTQLEREKENLTAIDTFIDNKKTKDVYSIILKAYTDGYSVYPDALVFALAMAAKQPNSEELRTAAYLAARTVCNSPEKLFLFVKLVNQLAPGKGIGKGVKRLVTEWYMNHKPMELLKSVTECTGAHGWSHKDLIKLCHINAKSNPGIYAVICYICKGLEKMKIECCDMPEAKPVILYLESLATFRKEKDRAELLKMVESFNFSFDQVTSHAIRHKWVWAEYIPRLPLHVLLANIYRLGHMRFINEDQPIAELVIKALTNQESIAKSNIHPAEVLIVRQKYEHITM